MLKFDFHDFSIELEDSLEIDEFKDLPHYYGIIFHTNKMKYQVIHNMLMGYRLIIYDNYGFSKDIPFKKETQNFLPEGVLTTWREDV